MFPSKKIHVFVQQLNAVPTVFAAVKLFAVSVCR